jgi:hypothetical protein
MRRGGTIRLLVWPALAAGVLWAALICLKSRGLLPDWATWTHVHLAPLAAWPVLTALAAAFGVGGFRYSLRTLAAFLLLATCAEALGLHWEPWYLHVRFSAYVETDENADEPEMWLENVWFTPDSSRVRTVMAYNGPGFLFDEWDIKTGERMTTRRLASRPNVRPAIRRSSGTPQIALLLAKSGDWCVVEDSCVIAQSDTGKELTRMVPDMGLKLAELSPDGQHMVAGGVWGRIEVWRRRRPEWWWGVFYLREFWATVIFAAFFAWSIRGDRHYFKVLDERLAASLAAKAAAKAPGGSG